MKFSMKLGLIFTAAIVSTLSGCAFFEQPLDDIGTIAPAADTDGIPTPSATPPPLPSATPPPLPTPSQASQVNEATSAPASSDGTYFIVSTIFEVPENVANLSFVHFTERGARRENALCEALFNKHQLTSATAVPSDALNLIIWPVVEGSTPDNCRDMVNAHEPLDISSETAATVNSNGPYLMSRNSSQQKQMIYDLSATPTGRLAAAVDDWQQILGGGVGSWQPVLKP